MKRLLARLPTRMPPASVRRLLFAAAVGCALLVPVAQAGAAQPEIVRTPPESYSEPGFVQCDGFAIDLSGTQRETFTVFRDAGGEIVRVIHHGQVRETMTNSVTGESITNRGVFTDFFTRVQGSDEFMHSVVGFDFMATSPGAGLVLQQVGRKVFSVDGQELVFFAGQTNVPQGPEAEAVFCAAVA